MNLYYFFKEKQPKLLLLFINHQLEIYSFIYSKKYDKTIKVKLLGKTENLTKLNSIIYEYTSSNKIQIYLAIHPQSTSNYLLESSIDLWNNAQEYQNNAIFSYTKNNFSIEQKFPKSLHPKSSAGLSDKLKQNVSSTTIFNSPILEEFIKTTKFKFISVCQLFEISLNQTDLFSNKNVMGKKTVLFNVQIAQSLWQIIVHSQVILYQRYIINCKNLQQATDAIIDYYYYSNLTSDKKQLQIQNIQCTSMLHFLQHYLHINNSRLYRLNNIFGHNYRKTELLKKLGHTKKFSMHNLKLFFILRNLNFNNFFLPRFNLIALFILLLLSFFYWYISDTIKEQKQKLFFTNQNLISELAKFNLNQDLKLRLGLINDLYLKRARLGVTSYMNNLLQFNQAISGRTIYPHAINWSEQKLRVRFSIKSDSVISGVTIFETLIQKLKELNFQIYNNKKLKEGQLDEDKKYTSQYELVLGLIY